MWNEIKKNLKGNERPFCLLWKRRKEGPLPRDTSLTHVTLSMANSNLLNTMPHAP